MCELIANHHSTLNKTFSFVFRKSTLDQYKVRETSKHEGDVRTSDESRDRKFIIIFFFLH